MATKNIVPRATGEGKLGTSSKKWLETNTVTGSFELLKASGLQDGSGNDLVVAGDNITVNKSSSGQFEISGSGSGSSAADDITIGDAAVNIGTTSGNTTINSANGQTTTISGSNVALTSENDVTVTGDLIPSVSSTYDLGVNANRWRNLRLQSYAYIYFGSSNDTHIQHVPNKGIKVGVLNENDGEAIFEVYSDRDQVTGPTLQINMTSTPNVNDTIGSLKYLADNDTGGDKNYGSITTSIVNKDSDDSFTGDMKFNVVSSGSLHTALLISGSDLRQTGSVDIPGHNATDSGLMLGGTLVTSTAAELNLLDVSAQAPTSGSSLRYNGSTFQWEVFSGGGGGGSTAADDITIGNAAVNIGTTSGDTTINSANGQTTTISGSNVVLDSENDISVNRNFYPENGSFSYQKFSLGSHISDRQWKNLYLKDAIYFSGSTNGPSEMSLSHQEGEGLTIGMGVSAIDNSEPYLNLSSGASQSLGPVFRISQNYTFPHQLSGSTEIGTLDFFGTYGRDSGNDKSTGGGTLAKVSAKRKDIEELSYTTDLVMTVASSGSLYDALIISGSSFSQTASVIAAGNVTPSLANTFDLGSSTNEWRDLYLGDNSNIYFGNDQDVEITHFHNAGLIMSMSAAGPGEPRFEIRSVNGAGSNTSGPTLTLHHFKSSFNVNNNDTAGTLVLQARNSAGLGKNYGKLFAKIVDKTNASERSDMFLSVMSNGSEANALVLSGTTSTDASVDIPGHNSSDAGLMLSGTLVTATASELNLLDGGTSVGSSITIADTDGFIINDGGTMKTIPASDLSTYVGGGGSGGGGKHGYVSTETADFTTVVMSSAQERQLYIVNHASNAITASLAIPSGSSPGSYADVEGYEINIKRFGAGTVHITGSAGVTAIDGSATFDLPSQYSSVTLVATGSQYIII